MDSRLYMHLNINEKINTKSWGFWRLPNPNGYFMTMIDNANSFNRKDYAFFTRFQVRDYHTIIAPKFGHNTTIWLGINRPFERLIPLCREIAHSFNSVIITEKLAHNDSSFFSPGTIIFKSRDTDKEYVWLYVDTNCEVYSCHEDKDEVLIESVTQLMELVKNAYLNTLK